VALGRKGVHEIFECNLASDEQEGLKQTAGLLKNAARIVDESLL